MPVINATVKNIIGAAIGRNARCGCLDCFKNRDAGFTGKLDTILGGTPGKADMERLSKLSGIPEWALDMSERTFGFLPEGSASRFARQFCESLPSGKDMDSILPAIELARTARLKSLLDSVDFAKKQELYGLLKRNESLWSRKGIGLERQNVESLARYFEHSIDSADSAAWALSRSIKKSAQGDIGGSAESASWSAYMSVENPWDADIRWYDSWTAEADTLIREMKKLGAL